MSFSTEVKDELAHVAPQCSHCEKATLAALVRSRGTLLLTGRGSYKLQIVCDTPAIARLVLKILHESYKLTTETVIRRSVLHKTPSYVIEIVSCKTLTATLIDLGIISEKGGLEIGIKKNLILKQCCGAAYLRGLFLGTGFISNPKGDFHFEMTVENLVFAEVVCELMKSKDINARFMKRRSNYVIYLKSASSILEFLAFTGAHQGALLIENERVVKSVRNEVNRKTNAEVANQAKSINASLDQIKAMEYVLEYYKIEEIPQALREVIDLRLNNPDASLKELGQLVDPPLSKSAIYHRVRRIEEMARQIKE